jgi:hypothetical protein
MNTMTAFVKRHPPPHPRNVLGRLGAGRLGVGRGGRVARRLWSHAPVASRGRGDAAADGRDAHEGLSRKAGNKEMVLKTIPSSMVKTIMNPIGYKPISCYNDRHESTGCYLSKCHKALK